MHVMSAFARAFRVERCQFLPEGLDEGILDVLVKEKVVRCYACLAAVEAFPPYDAACGYAKIGVPVHDAGALASEFKHHRGEIFRLRCGEMFRKCRAAGEEDQVPAAGEELRVHLAVALYHCREFLREGVGDESFKGEAHLRHVWRRLQDSGAACGDGADKRIQQQLHRIIPGRYYQGAAKGLFYDVAA